MESSFIIALRIFAIKELITELDYNQTFVVPMVQSFEHAVKGVKPQGSKTAATSS
jgi:hypothetical protein